MLLTPLDIRYAMLTPPERYARCLLTPAPTYAMLMLLPARMRAHDADAITLMLIFVFFSPLLSDAAMLPRFHFFHFAAFFFAFAAAIAAADITLLLSLCRRMPLSFFLSPLICRCRCHYFAAMLPLPLIFLSFAAFRFLYLLLFITLSPRRYAAFFSFFHALIF